MTAPKRFVVGQEVVVDPRHGPQLAAVVTKVGRKYLTVEFDRGTAWSWIREFDMTTGRLRDALARAHGRPVGAERIAWGLPTTPTPDKARHDTVAGLTFAQEDT